MDLGEVHPADLGHGATDGEETRLPELLNGGPVDLDAPETRTHAPHLLLGGPGSR